MTVSRPVVLLGRVVLGEAGTPARLALDSSASQSFADVDVAEHGGGELIVELQLIGPVLGASER